MFAATRSFSDVPPTHPFYDEITWAEANDIVNGFEDGTFKPTRDVTRQAAVAFLSNYNDAVYMTQSQSAFTAVGVKVQTATCAAGDRAVSGGGTVTRFDGSPNIDMDLTDSYPTAGSAAPAGPDDANGWTVRYETQTGVGPLSGTAYAWALCMPAESD